MGAKSAMASTLRQGSHHDRPECCAKGDSVSDAQTTDMHRWECGAAPAVCSGGECQFGGSVDDQQGCEADVHVDQGKKGYAYASM